MALVSFFPRAWPVLTRTTIWGFLHMQKFIVLAVLAQFTTSIAAAAGAEDNYFHGKTIRIVVGAEAGASYDIYSRLLSRHMGRHIPGQPTIVVQNVNAAGGLVAANQLFNTAERDGTIIGTLQRNSLLDSIIERPQARFRIEKFNWLGTPASMADNRYLFLIRSTLWHRTIEDLRKDGPPTHVGVVNSPIHILRDAFDLNVKIITGYGKAALDLAFERGELDGNGITYANLLSRKPQWLNKGLARIMIQFGSPERLPDLANVPTAQELTRTPEQLALVRLVEAPQQISYPMALPPNVPAERVAMLRKAFMDTMKDPAFRDEAIKMKLDYSPRDGKAITTAISEISGTPKAVIESYKRIFGARRMD